MAKCEECKEGYYVIESCTVNEQGEHHSFNDKPAIIHSDGKKYWLKNGELHRDNDLPAVIWENEDMHWSKDGKYHRTSGPARIWPKVNTKEWWYEGNMIISGIKLSEITFQYEEQIGTILENIEDKIYLGLLGDEKIMIGLEYG